jgi:hypothetical protein
VDCLPRCDLCKHRCRKKCGGCLEVAYCDRACQRRAWPQHRLECLRLSIHVWMVSGKFFKSYGELRLVDRVAELRGMVLADCPHVFDVELLVDDVQLDVQDTLQVAGLCNGANVTFVLIAPDSSHDSMPELVSPSSDDEHVARTSASDNPWDGLS